MRIVQELAPPPGGVMGDAGLGQLGPATYAAVLPTVRFLFRDMDNSTVFL